MKRVGGLVGKTAPLQGADRRFDTYSTHKLGELIPKPVTSRELHNAERKLVTQPRTERDRHESGGLDSLTSTIVSKRGSLQGSEIFACASKTACSQWEYGVFESRIRQLDERGRATALHLV